MKKLKVVLVLLVAFVMACSSACVPLSSLTSGSDSGSTQNPNLPPESEVLTVAQALELCGEEGNETTERYYVRATVDSVTNPTYGAMIVSDETGSISVYNSKNADGTVNYADMEDKPYKGDEVLLYCTLQNYNGSKEIKSAWIIEFKHAEIEIDQSEYTEMTVEKAREQETGAKVKVTGVVAAITYANGMKPNGVYLVDGTSSIYVYDGDLAGRVAKGDEITVLASKTYWILEGEMSSAEQHGYNGCNQLENAYLLSTNATNKEFDKSWIKETTVKNILNTPVTEDITTIIYKVNALVARADGTGFINYYFNDIDGVTSSYAYSQCNGSDFAWIDQFNGKICTVYIAAHNAKSSSTDCFFRFMPIAIEDNGYTFDLANAGEYAVEYHAVDKFLPVYNANPALELETTVSSELLGFEGATLTYSSSNTAVADFTVSEDKAIMNLKDYGTATITITGYYNGVSYSKEITVKYEAPTQYEAITVAQAIATAPDTAVTVKGIVGPSVVNRDGFYLFGEDGSVISVLFADASVITTLSIGNEIVISGMRERFVKDDSSTFTGQTCIVDAELLVNNYGNYEYSTEKFVTGLTPAEFYALDATVDYSTTVFVLTATVQYNATNFYTNYKLVSGDTSITLYSSSGSQYAFLEQFANQEVTVEIAACNWNDKTYWTGCILAVRTENGKVYNTLNFDAK